MQISYNATRVKIWNLFLFAKNFIAKNFEVKKIRREKKFEVKKNRSCATRVEMFREPIFENLARGFPVQRFFIC